MAVLIKEKELTIEVMMSIIAFVKEMNSNQEPNCYLDSPEQRELSFQITSDLFFFSYFHFFLF